MSHHCPARVARDSRGATLVLTLVVLVGLSAISLALVSIGSLEPLISRNHVDVVRARYLAEAGLEHAYDMLALDAGAWNGYLVGATCAVGTLLVDATLPQRTPAEGRFTVLVRNDCASGDERLTGAPSDDAADPTHDHNGRVIAVSTGIVGRTTHTITASIFDERPTRERSQSVPRVEVKTYNWADR